MIDPVPLGETATAPLPPIQFEIEVGGIIGTLAWAAAAYWYRRDIGTALKELVRDDL